jgi:fatty-acyl-CoA synthase
LGIYDQTEYIINNSEDKVIFVDATLVPLLEKIALLETVECYVLINADKNFKPLYKTQYIMKIY